MTKVGCKVLQTKLGGQSKTAANMGFAASVAGRCKHRQQFAIMLQSGLDGMLLGFG